MIFVLSHFTFNTHFSKCQIQVPVGKSYYKYGGFAQNIWMSDFSSNYPAYSTWTVRWSLCSEDGSPLLFLSSMTHSAGWQQRQLWLVNAWYLSRIGTDSSAHPVVAFGEQPSLCTAFEGHSVTLSRLPLSTEWVARPQQGSLQLTQVLLSCDQEDQDHPLTVVWLARYRRQVPSGHLSGTWRKPEDSSHCGK